MVKILNPLYRNTLPMVRFKELSALCSGLHTFCWFQYNDNKLCLIKILTQTNFNLLPVIYFSKCMHCDRHFLVVKINAFPCILNGACIAVLE